MARVPPHLQLPKGMHDRGPEETEQLRTVEAEWIAHARLWGHLPVQVPPVGLAETFTTGHSAAADRGYTFVDRGGRALALVPDSLPAIAALMARRGDPEQRVSFTCAVFRHRHARRRFFHHLGAASLFPDGPEDREARRVEELLTLAHRFLLPRFGVRVRLADLGAWRAALAEGGIDDASGTALLYELTGLPTAAWAAHLAAARAGATAVRLAELVAAHDPGPVPPAALEGFGHATDTRLRGLRALAERVSRREGVEMELALADLHGNEHQDGLAFQLIAESDGRRMCDGGGYGRLARAMFGHPAMLCSTAMGLEEIALRSPGGSRPAVTAVVRAGAAPGATARAGEIADILRRAGVRTWEGPAARDIARDLAHAEALGADWYVRVDADEVDGGVVRIRGANGALEAVAIEALPAWLAARRDPIGRPG